MNQRYQIKRRMTGSRYVYDVIDTHDHNTRLSTSRTEAHAIAHAQSLNLHGPATIKAATPAIETPARPTTGWSKYSRRRAGAPRDIVSDVMAASFGLRSAAVERGDCHYCGLDPRTCDCH